MARLALPVPVVPEVRFLEGLSYLQRRRVIRHRMQGQYPRFFYKFRPADLKDEMALLARLRSFFVESHLWLSHHESFNDPFDMKAHVVVEGSREEKEARLKALITDHSGAPWKRRREMLRDWMARPPAQMAAMLAEAFRQLAGSAGICSFGGDPRSILMWTHYAQNHEGYCLQFEFARDPRTFGWAQEVEYKDEYPRVNFVDRSKVPDQLFTVLTRKHSGWSYEKEWRLIHLEGANSLMSFRPESLVGIIFGCRAPTALYSKVRTMLAERDKAGLPPVRVYRAEQDRRAYRLRIRRAT